MRSFFLSLSPSLRLQRVLNSKFLASNQEYSYKIDGLYRDIQDLEKRLSLSTDNGRLAEHDERIQQLEQRITLIMEREANTSRELELAQGHNRELRGRVTDLEKADQCARETLRDLAARLEQMECQQGRLNAQMVKIEVCSWNGRGFFKANS